MGKVLPYARAQILNTYTPHTFGGTLAIRFYNGSFWQLGGTEVTMLSAEQLYMSSWLVSEQLRDIQLNLELGLSHPLQPGPSPGFPHLVLCTGHLVSHTLQSQMSRVKQIKRNESR